MQKTDYTCFRDVMLVLHNKYDHNFSLELNDTGRGPRKFCSTMFRFSFLSSAYALLLKPVLHCLQLWLLSLWYIFVLC